MKHIDEVVSILTAQHDLSLVKDSHVSGGLFTHAQFQDLLIDRDFFRNDDKLNNMMTDLANKEQGGDTDYSFRMTIKHLTTRALEVVGEAEKTTPTSNVQVEVLGQLLSELYDSIDGFEPLFKHILTQPDRRNVPELLTRALGDTSIAAFQTRLQARTELLAKQFIQFQDALYVLELEELTGVRGDWREIADANRHYRTSVKAVLSLRLSHGVGLSEAKNTVDAYVAGMFK